MLDEPDPTTFPIIRLQRSYDHSMSVMLIVVVLPRWSNTGSCVDIFAPGVDIYAACGGAERCPAVTDTAYAWASGTSMAVPHVAGVAALYLSQHPSASPAEVKEKLMERVTMNLIQSPYLLPDTPNRLLYSNIV